MGGFSKQRSCHLALLVQFSHTDLSLHTDVARDGSEGYGSKEPGREGQEVREKPNHLLSAGGDGTTDATTINPTTVIIAGGAGAGGVFFLTAGVIIVVCLRRRKKSRAANIKDDEVDTNEGRVPEGRRTSEARNNEESHGNQETAGNRQSSRKSESNTSTDPPETDNGGPTDSSSPRSSSEGSDKPTSHPNYDSTALQEVDIHAYKNLPIKSTGYSLPAPKKDNHAYLKLRTSKAKPETPKPRGEGEQTADILEIPYPSGEDTQRGEPNGAPDGSSDEVQSSDIYETPYQTRNDLLSSTAYEIPPPPNKEWRKEETYANQGQITRVVEGEDVSYYNTA